jgi:Vault protein inter-alpha-trypsin domain
MSSRKVSHFAGLSLTLAIAACGRPEKPLAPRSQTWAELRTVRRNVTVTPPDERERAPYARERLVDGSRVTVDAGGLAWLRRDGGATLLVRGPAKLVLHAHSVEIESGRVFVDTPSGPATELDTPSGKLEMARVRASLDVSDKGSTEAYVLDGEVRVSDSVRVQAGERMVLGAGGAPKIQPASVWQDWTGGLATTDRPAVPAPYGVGTIGARPPGDTGAPRFPLAIQRLDVNVKIDGDFAVTEVDERFFNASSKTVEGIYRFRSPEGAAVYRFGVDRAGELTWGRVKESAAAAAQYQSNVYAGSTEDPALLEWEGPGVYQARLYPIAPGDTRRVVVRYSEWLPRSGEKGERRLYVYPMAADGAESSLPHIEELNVKVDLGGAGAQDVRVGMAGTRTGNEIVVRAHDFIPRADLAVELYDRGTDDVAAYHAKHQPDYAVLPPDARAAAQKEALGEADYILVPVRAHDIPSPEGGLDIAIVVDSSAANDDSSMALARASTLGLLSHLGDADRAVVWSGAEALRPVLPDTPGMVKIDASLERRYSAALATLPRGGATDLGAMLTSAAAALDPARRGVIVYVGDGRATVGELGLDELEQRLSKLPHPPRVFALGVGREVDMALLDGVSSGGFAEHIEDAHGAALASLRLLEVAERPAWVGAEVDLGPDVERVYPRNVHGLLSDQTVLVVGRLKGGLPSRAIVHADGKTRELRLAPRQLDDHGDLRRRWGLARLDELLRTKAGRAAMVDVGTRYGIITPVTSYYVPTARELHEERRELIPMEDRETEQVEEHADNKEGGTGTRAKGEEGSMGNPNTRSTNKRYAVQGPQDNPDSHAARQRALSEAQEFGMIGLLDTSAAGDPNAPTAPWGRDEAKAAETAPAPQASTTSNVDKAPPSSAKTTGNAWGDEIGDAYGAGGLGLAGTGEGGGGKGEGLGLGQIGTLGHGAGTGTGQGFGSGHGRLGGAHKAPSANVRMGATRVTGRLPAEVVQRIVRQNYGRFRVCYEQGLSKNPNLEGKVSVRFSIDNTGAVSSVTNGGSDMPDSAVVACVVSAFNGLSFPQPEGGVVTVIYPIAFTPGGGGASPTPPPALQPPALFALAIDVLPRVVALCSPAADLPLPERITLWRERLAKVAGSPSGVLGVYQRVLAGCEAPSWAERRPILSAMLDALPTVTTRVQLWRSLKRDRAASDTLYRGIVARVKTADQMRELHTALGLKSIDPGLLEKLIKNSKNPAELVAKLRTLIGDWRDDFKLALALLDALEDAGDAAGARDYLERLRARPDLDAHVRTEVGELYLRLSASDKDAGKKAQDLASARRAFGEIVEFSPDDPVARRRLGDLLRAHGWYSDARRQYETLAALAPDDPSTALLIAAAANGEGQLEAAVRWTEKGRGAGAPDVDSGPAATARAFAATFLAWGRSEARAQKRDKELTALINRSQTVLSSERANGGIRATLSWSHPEFHPVFYSNALGSAMPAPEGDVTLGIAQVRLPSKSGTFVEVRLEPGDVEAAARLGAEATLTVVFDELGKGEKIVKMPVHFQRGGPATLRFSVENGEVTGG